MASATGIKAGAAFIELAIDDSKLMKGLRAAAKKVESMGSGLFSLGSKIAAAAGAISAPMMLMLHQFTKVGTQLLDMSKQSGASVEALSELGYAADQTGANIDVVMGSLRGLAKVMYQAEGGNKKILGIFDALGLSFEELKKASPEDRLQMVLNALNGVSDVSKRAAMGMKLLGKGGLKLIPMAGEFANLRIEAQKLGYTFKTSDAIAAHNLEDAMTRLSYALRSIAIAVGSAIAPIMEEWLGQIRDVVGSVATWISQNKGLVVALFKLAAVAAGVGAGLMAVGTAIMIAGSLLGTALSVISTVIGALLSPIGLLVATLAGLGYAFIQTSADSRAAADRMGQDFQSAQGIVKQSLDGIVNALKANDLGLAAKIAWLGIKAAFLQGTAWLREIWIDFKTWLLKGLNGIATGAKATWEIVVNALTVACVDGFNGVMEIWDAVILNMGNKWADMIGDMEKNWVRLKSVFSSTKELKEALRAVDEHTSKVKQAMVSMMRDRDEDRQKFMQGLQDTHKQKMSNIAKEGDAADEEFENAKQAEIQQAREGLESAKKELAKAVQEANKKVEDKEKLPEYLPDPSANKGIDEFKPKEGPRELLEDMSKLYHTKIKDVAMEAMGSFSGAVLSRLGVGQGVTSPDERTAEATEKTADNTERMADAIEELTDELEFD